MFVVAGPEVPGWGHDEAEADQEFVGGPSVLKVDLRVTGDRVLGGVGQGLGFGVDAR